MLEHPLWDIQGTSWLRQGKAAGNPREKGKTYRMQAAGCLSKSDREAETKESLTAFTLWCKVRAVIAQNEIRMKRQWFKRCGWFHVPVSVPGLVVCLLAALFCLTVLIAVDRHSHSVSDTLYGVFPYFVCTFLLLDWIGGRTSEKRA
jgi:hypothetical protein